MPRYLAFLGLLQSTVLFIPEVTWAALGLGAQHYIQNFPVFVQYYVNSSDFMNAMFVFWLTCPITFLTSTYLCIVHINFQGYPAYLQRRAIRLKQQGKTSDYSFIAVVLVMLVVYVWVTVINLREPEFLGDFVPAKSRLSMLIIHVGSIALLLPVSIAVMTAELRANIFKS